MPSGSVKDVALAASLLGVPHIDTAASGPAFASDFAPIATHYRLGSDASWALTEVMQLLPARFAVLMDDGSAAEVGAAIDAVARHLGGFRMQEDTGRYRLSVGRHQADVRLAKFTANSSSAGRGGADTCNKKMY